MLLVNEKRDFTCPGIQVGDDFDHSGKMAEAGVAVDQRQNRFFCHQCSTEISPNLPVSNTIYHK